MLRRCQYCGGAPIERERPRERHLVCPGCRGTMTELEAGSVTIDRCDACGGVWYDRGELEQAIAEEKAKVPALWDHLPGSEPARETKVVYRSCPICRQSMLRKRKGPAIIDLCGPHGAFLDAGELEQIAQHREPEPPQEEKKPNRVPRPASAPDLIDDESIMVGAAAIDLITSVLFDW